MGRLTQTSCRAGLALARHFAFFLGVWAQPLTAQTLSEAKVFTRTDAALAMLNSATPEAASDLLVPLYDAAFRDRELSATAAQYPLLGLAYVAMAEEDWTRSARMAANVAGALEFAGLRGTDTWFRAQVIQGTALYHMGETAQADEVLRGVFPGLAETDLPQEHQLALYVLARIASEERRADEADVRRAFLQIWHPGGNVAQTDAIHIWFFDIVARFREGADRAVLVREMSELRSQAAQIPNIENRQLLHYRGYHGVLKAHAGDFASAEGDLRSYYDALMAEQAYGRDLWENALFLGAVTGQTQGATAQIAFFEAVLPLARARAAPAWYRAQYLREMGHAAAQLGAQDDAQEFYRTAYAEARQAYRANAGLVTQLRGFVDLSHSGMAGFDFAGELGAMDVADLKLRPVGEHVLRLFLQGNYTVSAELVARQVDNGDAVFALNAALHHAVIGELDRSRVWLLLARRGETDTAMMADLVEAMALIWGTSHEVEKAATVLDRLETADLPPALTRMVLALWAQRAFHMNQTAEMRAALQAFGKVQGEDARYPLWDLLAEVTAMEPSFGVLPEARNMARYSELKSRIDAAGNLPVLRDYLDAVYYQNAREGMFAGDAVAHLGALNTRLAEDTPKGHSLRLVAAFTLSNALYWRGENAAALEWAERAAEEVRANAYGARDVMGFILSRQADLLRILGAPDRAASVAAGAWDIAREESGDFAGAVLESYANALYAFTGDPGRVVTLLQDELQYEDRFTARERVALWSLLAQAQAAVMGRSEVLTSLNRALAAMEGPGTDWRAERARLLWTRAQTHARHADPRAGFADMVASNDLYHAWRQDRLSQEDADAIDTTAWPDRVRWEAALGWQLAQEVRP